MVRPGNSYRAARREAWKNSCLAPSPEKKPKFGPGEWLAALLALPLTATSLLVNNIMVATIFLWLAVAILAAAVVLRGGIRCRYRVVICLLFVIVGGFLHYLLYNEHKKRELGKNVGILYPGNTPRPQTHCPLNQHNFAIFAGGTVVSNSTVPTILLTIAGQEVIAGENTVSGAFQLRTVRLLDDQYESLAEVRDNRLWIHPNARRERPDFSTLVVYDRRGNEALRLQFLNPNTIEISGIFRFPGRPPVAITSSAIRIGGVASISRNCIFDSVRGIVIQ